MIKTFYVMASYTDTPDCWTIEETQEGYKGTVEHGKTKYLFELHDNCNLSFSCETGKEVVTHTIHSQFVFSILDFLLLAHKTSGTLLGKMLVTETKLETLYG